MKALFCFFSISLFLPVSFAQHSGRNVAYQSRTPVLKNQPHSFEKKADEGQDRWITPVQAHKFGIQERAIIVTDRGFFPNKINVRRNVPVRLFLTSTNSRKMCFFMVMGDQTIKRGVDSTNLEVVNITPKQTGPIEFSCPINHIKGTLVVRD